MNTEERIAELEKTVTAQNDAIFKLFSLLAQSKALTEETAALSKRAIVAAEKLAARIDPHSAEPDTNPVIKH